MKLCSLTEAIKRRPFSTVPDDVVGCYRQYTDLKFDNPYNGIYHNKDELTAIAYRFFGTDELLAGKTALQSEPARGVKVRSFVVQPYNYLESDLSMTVYTFKVSPTVDDNDLVRRLLKQYKSQRGGGRNWMILGMTIAALQVFPDSEPLQRLRVSLERSLNSSQISPEPRVNQPARAPRRRRHRIQ